MKKIIPLVLILLIGGLAGYFATSILNQVNFENLGPEQMYERIIKELKFAVKKAAKEGSYKCCISPPCTMCYMGANIWNNQTPGTCACDELIAQGKDPCPQCKRGLCETDKKGACEIEGLE